MLVPSDILCEVRLRLVPLDMAMQRLLRNKVFLLPIRTPTGTPYNLIEKNMHFSATYRVLHAKSKTDSKLLSKIFAYV